MEDPTPKTARVANLWEGEDSGSLGKECTISWFNGVCVKPWIQAAHLYLTRKILFTSLTHIIDQNHRSQSPMILLYGAFRWLWTTSTYLWNVPRTSNEHKVLCVWKYAPLIKLAKFARVLQKGARFKIGWMAGQNKTVQFLKLRSVAQNCTGLRKIVHVVALFYSHGLATNNPKSCSQVSKQGFLRVWRNCTRFGKVCAQYVVDWLVLYSFWGLNTNLCTFEVPGKCKQRGDMGGGYAPNKPKWDIVGCKMLYLCYNAFKERGSSPSCRLALLGTG